MKGHDFKQTEDLSQDFHNGVRALRMLILEEMDRSGHVMPHTHLSEITKESQWEYCWRCKIERVMGTPIESYRRVCR